MTAGDVPIGWLVLLIVLFVGVFVWSLRTGRRNRDGGRGRAPDDTAPGPDKGK